MNNGKTRIYELSKELNRDNKDILEICERLNIAVKSHSSTITDAQVERIRAEAKRGDREATRSSKSARKTKGSRKPQIREIVKSTTSAPRPNFQSSEAQGGAVATSPRPPIKPRLNPPPSSLRPNIPTEVEEATEVPSDRRDRSVATDSPNLPESEAVAIEPDPPQLLSPPPRPARDKGESQSTRNGQPTTLKKPKKKTKTSQTDVESSEPVAQKPQRLQKPPSPIQLDSPEAPTPPSPPKGDSEEETTLELANKPQKLRRPTPPRPSKRKDWEEEEEETPESKGKSGKASKLGGKNKRRSPQTLLDDDDDFGTDDRDSSSTLPSVGLSVVRPPKPPSLSRPPAPAASKASRAKKPPSKGENSAARSESRDKRRVRRNATVSVPESVVLPESLTVQELAALLQTPETEIIKNLFCKGIAVNITQTIDFPTAKMVAEELDIQVELPEQKSAAAKTTEMLDEADLESLQRRPPVVTIMGHVDHGKTTLLDSIRKTKVAQGEAGGITQHIGAYHVDVEHEDKTEQVVFLDTPGHEAFTAMRARGTRVTDIAILVVAADDGVQPQTKEAISHAKAAGVPLIVAINKIDKPSAQPDRIKQELSEQGLMPEEWGGETIMVPVSAIQGDNLDTLLEMILLVSEIEILEANPNRTGKGTTIEAHLDKARGPVASLLVQNGTLRVGDTLVAGSTFGKIRAMVDDRGNRVEAATPSFAVEVLGLNDVPGAGDEFEVFENEKEARAIAESRAATQRESRLQKALSSRRVSLSSLSAQAQEGELKELNLIIKADVQGSVEAILSALKQLPQNEVHVRVLLAAPGEITETDVDLAAASGAVIVGFNTALASGAQAAGDREGVDIHEYNIIYQLLDEIQAAMEGLLEPEEVEEPLGTAEVRAVFPVGRGAVAGCYVLSGKVVRNRQIRVRRGGEVVYDGILDSLKRMKEDEREVKTGFECGIGTSKFNNWKEGDIIEAYQMILKRRTLSVK